MTNATIARSAATTPSSAPIAKLYKMCKWGQHSACKRAFETHSVCNCACHKPAAPKAVKAKAAPKAKAPAKRKAAAPVRYSQPVKQPSALAQQIAAMEIALHGMRAELQRQR